MDGSGAQHLGHRPALDGLRAVAILLVMWQHSALLEVPGATLVEGGLLGVDVFFVLSGFLITTLLLERRTVGPGGVGLRSFYARRAVRLLPALVVFLAAHLVLVAITGDDVGRDLRTAAAALTYTTNWAPSLGWDLSVDQVHLWTLALEEQFYLAWPLVLAVLARLRPRLALALIGAAVVAVALRRIQLTLAFDGGFPVVYQRTDARFDALLVGCGVAVALRAGVQLSRRASTALGVVGTLVLAAFVAVADAFGDLLYLGGFTAVAVAAGAIIIALLRWDTPLARGLAWSPLVGLGRLSYSLYLWHVMAYTIALRLWPQPSAPRFVAAQALALLLAWVSFAGVERPLQEAHRRWSDRRRTERSSLPVPPAWLAPVAVACLLLVTATASSAIRWRDAGAATTAVEVGRP